MPKSLDDAIAALKAEYTRLSVNPTNTGYTAHQVWGAIDRAVSISRASQGSGAGTEGEQLVRRAEFDAKLGVLFDWMTDSNKSDFAKDQFRKALSRCAVELGIAAYLSALPEQTGERWRSMDDTCNVGIIDVRSITSYRWLPYSGKSEQYRRGIKGRWQRATEYGWENSNLPKNGEWVPIVKVPAPPAGESP